MMESMKDLWNKASLFGRVSLDTMDDGEYHCCIRFNTINHIEINARSGFDCPSPEDALLEATDNAQKIIDSLDQTISRFKMIK